MNRCLHFGTAVLLLGLFSIGCGERSSGQGSPAEQRQRAEGRGPTNQDVANEVATLLREADVRGSNVEIMYQRGRAELAGEMVSRQDKETAVKVVQQHPSVDTVEDRLTVVP